MVDIPARVSPDKTSRITLATGICHDKYSTQYVELLRVFVRILIRLTFGYDKSRFKKVQKIYEYF